MRRATRPSFGVLFNPNAGSGRRRSDDLLAIVDGRGFVRCVKTDAELKAFVLEVQSSHVDVVAVAGGDGTLGRVATALYQHLGSECPVLAPIGGGTMNTVATSLGVPRRPAARGLRRLIEADSGRYRLRRQGTMRIGVDRLGFMFGVGVPARFLQLYESGGRPGRSRAASSLARLLLAVVRRDALATDLFARVEATVRLEPPALEIDDFSLLYAAVIDDIGLGFRPTPRAEQGLDGFQLLAGTASATTLVRALPAIWRGRSVSGPGWRDELASEVHIAFRQPTVYMVDGDVDDAPDELVVRSGPAFEFLVGA